MLCWSIALAGCITPSWAAEAEVRAHAGGQLETASHGIVDLGWRKGRGSVELFTDTLDARITEQGATGRATAGLRVQGFAAGLWITPWLGGAPDPSRAHLVSYAGLDVGAQRYLPGGTWVGGAAFTRALRFQPLATAIVRVPNALWAQAELQAGVWRSEGAVRGQVAAGADWTWPGRLSPHLRGSVQIEPSGTVAPIVGLWAGAAWNTDDVVATRLGGLTPYNVPFAGAAWAELWVEDYAVARLGGRLSAGDWHGGLVVDVGTWTAPTFTLADGPIPARALGVAWLGGWEHGAWFADLAVAYSPTLPRQAGVWPVPVYLLVGTRWRTLP